MTGLDKAIKHFGSQAALARKLGLSSMAVSLWKKRGLPILAAIRIEEATNNLVTRAELRPDIFKVAA